MAALKKKKAVPVAGTAFKDGPDATGLKHSANKEHRMNLTYSAEKERQMNLTCYAPTKPSPLGLKTHTQRG